MRLWNVTRSDEERKKIQSSSKAIPASKSRPKSTSITAVPGSAEWLAQKQASNINLFFHQPATEY